ncbi:MAG: division/cell wall cluster transcriptional repressor MraZ [Clostridia bacterium]|nr:division/cell wall cluster transcriptional repressor MraZ [Clostridia bacterium]MBQ2249487.1 division/cell wall cluster transcriptional repressor MraZ [Clostridia bacterium]MBQ5612742.1 division/cell wall cluster transcriptional repressor MraZ [Clostridia bacterium]MBQ5661639.1 division/cell wall cluster transcriptional repressor MraZ [Clostridia bacterium]MBQ5772585.1 division/cell wall cluster transcriptional repressor MraZ [Clostridia bacterium]
MLGGEYRHGMDAKNRVFIPAKLREELGQTFIVAKDLREKCLKVYSQAEWDRYLAPIKNQERRLAERVLRFLSASMTQVTPDSQGRILLPKDLAQYAEIEHDVVVVGCYDYAEIWAEEAYSRLKENEDVEEMIRELESFGL